MRWRILTLALTILTQTANALEVRGVSEADLARVKQELPEAFRGETSMEQIDQLIRALARDGKYERVYAEQSGGNLQIVATPTRQIGKISIQGTRAIDHETLLSLIGLNEGDRIERKRVIEAGERIKNTYGERGYFNTVVEVNFLKLEDQRLHILFAIEEKEPCRIEAITIQTENKSLLERLERIAFKHQRRPLTTERVRNLSQQLTSFLMDNQYFLASVSDPEVKYNSERTRAELTLKILDPYRYDFLIDPFVPQFLEEPGRDLFFSRQILFRAMGLENQETRMMDPPTEIAERLRQLFLKNGFPNVEVRQEVTEFKSEFFRRVRIHIKENARVRIGELLVSGRMSRPAAYYADLIRQSDTPLLQRGYYNRQELDQALQSLIESLRGQGYLRAKVKSSRIEYPTSPDKARVVVVLDEGPLTQITGIRFQGNSAFSAEDLARVIGLKVGEPLRLAQLQLDIEAIKNFYQQKGYLEVRITNEGDELVNYSERGSQASIDYQIAEGPRIEVASVLFEGNSFTQTSVIRRLVDLKPGIVLTPELIEETESRLIRMGLFSRVSVRTLEEGTPIAKRTVIVSVAEKYPGEFRVGFGATSERTLSVRGFTVTSYNNLGGTARAVSGRAEVTSHVIEVDYPQYLVTVGYLEPFMFGTRLRGRVNVTSSSRIFEFTRQDDVTKITDSNRIDFFLERDFTRHLRVAWKAWSLDGRKEYERRGRCIDPSFVPNSSCPPKTLQIATMGPIIDLDYRDNPFLPTRGSYSTWNLDYSSPNFASSSLVEFVRTEAEHRRYYRLGSPKLVLANSLRGGYLANLSPLPGSGVPTSEAFFLGGQATLRGFAVSENADRVPNQTDLPVERTNQPLIKNDSHYFLFKSELRFPLVDDHGGVLFYDGGLVNVTGTDVKIQRPYRDAVGIGYRYNTPVGPLALDIGFKINPTLSGPRKESPFRIHFSFGTF